MSGKGVGAVGLERGLPPMEKLGGDAEAASRFGK